MDEDLRLTQEGTFAFRNQMNFWRFLNLFTLDCDRGAICPLRVTLWGCLTFRWTCLAISSDSCLSERLSFSLCRICRGWGTKKIKWIGAWNVVRQVSARCIRLVLTARLEFYPSLPPSFGTHEVLEDAQRFCYYCLGLSGSGYPRIEWDRELPFERYLNSGRNCNKRILPIFYRWKSLTRPHITSCLKQNSTKYLVLWKILRCQHRLLRVFWEPCSGLRRS